MWNLKTQGQGYGCDCYPARPSVCIYAKAFWYLEARERLCKEEDSSYSIGLWGKDMIHKVVDSPPKKGPLVP